MIRALIVSEEDVFEVGLFAGDRGHVIAGERLDEPVGVSLHEASQAIPVDANIAYAGDSAHDLRIEGPGERDLYVAEGLHAQGVDVFDRDEATASHKRSAIGDLLHLAQ